MMSLYVTHARSYTHNLPTHLVCGTQSPESLSSACARCTSPGPCDQIPGECTCAHCDETFLSLAALKHHINGGHCTSQPLEAAPLLKKHSIILARLNGGTFGHLMGYKS